MSKINPPTVFAMLIGLSAIGLTGAESRGICQAQTLDWIERYSLAADRSAMLSELIPGSEEYYFYHCLNHQVIGEWDKAEALLTQWKADERARHSGYLQRIEDRQHLLTYQRSPDRSIEYLRNRLNIQLEHPAPSAAGARLYPSVFDNLAIDDNRLMDEVSPDQLTREGLRRYAARVLADAIVIDPAQFAGLLNRVDGPWLPNLASLVIKELQNGNPDDRTFGDREAHKWLTLDELKSVAKTIPRIAASDAMVSHVLSRLRPTADEDMRQQPHVRSAYLERVDTYASTLPEAFVSLQAAILYQRLLSDLATNEFNRERFIRYLKLPRSSELVPETAIQGKRIVAQLSQDFNDLAMVPAVGDEQPMIRAYLEHFFKDADSPKAFEGMLKPDYLRRVFAETKLLVGVEPAERWYEMLDPSQRQLVRDRVELTLAPTNPRVHSPDRPTTLQLDLKRVEKLVVRIYRIHTHSYYRTRTNPIDTDIDLDGLVPTSERQLEFSLAPSRRHRETIELPEIEGRGLWIVDLLGGGLRARAMVRRGELQYTITQSAGGQRVIAFDENRRALPNATLIASSQQFKADENGIINLPPSDQATVRTAILQDNDLATPVALPTLEESYSLQAAMFVDRQQLISGRQAELVVRPRLLMSGKAIDPTLLENAVVTVTATDLDGIATTKRFDPIDLHQANEIGLPVRVPPRLANLTAILTGQVRGLAKNDRKELSASRSWDVATVRRTTLTSSAFLTRDGESWVIETRGRGGEAIPGAMVQVNLQPSVRVQPVSTTLQSDEFGRIQLGTLTDILSINISSGGQSNSIDLRTIDAHWPARLNAVAGSEIRLPLQSPLVDISRYRLLSTRSGQLPETELTDSLKVSGGLLVIKELSPGDYQLHDLVLQQTTLLSVTAGPVVGEVAAGLVRQLELPPRSELGIESLEPVAEGLKVKLSGVGPMTRIHLIAKRYIDGARVVDDLRLPELATTTRGVWHATSGYISDLRLGEEYQYVLRRQYSAKYPGVMLPQPGLILNPWETRSTDNESQSVAAGDAPMAATAPPAPMMDASEKSMEKQGLPEDLSADYDFLRDHGGMVINLRPDKDGVLIVPADVIDGMPIIEVVVADPLTVLKRTWFQPLVEADVVDLRLANALDAKRDLAFARGVVIASKDGPLDLKSLGSAQIQVYSSIAELMRLYMTLQGDDRLKEFLPIASWHTLDESGKRSLYGRLACHELHLFLSVHDIQFFDAVVRPYLKNKPEKQFVDHYLLGNDLTPWTQMWRYRELNAAEKILLAKRVPTIADTVRREFREMVELRPDDATELRKLVEFGLAGTAMFDDVAAEVRWADDGLMDRDGSFMFGAIADGEALGDALGRAANEPSGPAAGAPSPRSRKSAESEILRRSAGLQRLSESADKNQWMARGGDLKFDRSGREEFLAFFQNLDSTKQWAESQWDRVRVSHFGPGSPEASPSASMQSPELIPINAFWLALANGVDAGNPNGNNLNEHLLRPMESRHAALVALALCGLPLEAGDVKLPIDDKPFAPNHPVAVVTKRLVALQAMEGEASLLVGQRFTDSTIDSSNDPKAEIPVAPDEFVIHHVYRGEVILTNPTPKQQTVDVLWQIPAGSLPLAGGQATDSKTLTLDAFAVQRIEYFFYFPVPGDYVHYPVCVGTEGRVVARGTARTFNVVSVPSKLDEGSWPAIAVSGDSAKISGFLAKANLRKIDLGLVAHRMKDREIYDVVTAQLAKEQLNRPDLWGYSFHHRDTAGMKTFLSQQDGLVQSVGPVFHADLLEVDSIDRHLYEFLEYSPLVQARIHSLRTELEILNPTFKEQYLQLLRVLAHQREADVTQQLAVVHYMILQNRIEEAIKRFVAIDSVAMETRLQYDYLAGYLALHRSDYAAATKIATTYAEHPVPRWRERFGAMLANLQQRDQLMEGSQLAGAEKKPAGVRAGDADLAVIDRDRRNADAATLEPFVKVDIDGSALRIEHRNASDATINLYAVDLELLFSKTPFVREDLATMAMVQPTHNEKIELDSKDGVLRFPLNDKLARQTLLVEVVAGAARSTTLYYGGKLSAYVSQGFGQLQVSDSATRQPVEGAYVKVYSRQQDGTVAFYKDGYTDLRGRFDYVSVSTGDLAAVQKFSILVIDPERGATLHEAAPPTR